MQRLILMRHAEAETASPTGRDRDRPLSEKGALQATAMGAALAERGVKPDMALVSGAVRTRQTWAGMETAFGAVEVVVAEALHNAPADVLRRYVEDAEDKAGCLLLLAHNPGVHQLALEYLVEGAASPAAVDRLSAGFPPASAVLFTVDAAGRATYEGFINPRELTS